MPLAPLWAETEAAALLCEKRGQHNVTMARRRFMQSFQGISACSPFAAKTHPALTSFTDEVCATIARLFAYMGTLALLGILAVHGWDHLELMLDEEPASSPTWSIASRSYPALAVRPQDLRDKSASYTILRHPGGGQLKRGCCTGTDLTADWMTSGGNPQLRGAL